MTNVATSKQPPTLQAQRWSRRSEPEIEKSLPLLLPAKLVESWHPIRKVLSFLVLQSDRDAVEN